MHQYSKSTSFGVLPGIAARLCLPAVLIVILFLGTSCLGTWHAELNFICFPNGAMKSYMRIFPQDDDARNHVADAVKLLKKYNPTAEIEERTAADNTFIIVKRSYQASKHSFLQKKGDSWVFAFPRYRVGKEFKLTRLSVAMPGWIKTSNASVVYGNYAQWDGETMPDTFKAESNTMPISGAIWTGFTVILVILSVSIGLFIRERRRGNLPEEAKDMENGSPTEDAEAQMKEVQEPPT